MLPCSMSRHDLLLIEMPVSEEDHVDVSYRQHYNALSYPVGSGPSCDTVTASQGSYPLPPPLKCARQYCGCRQALKSLQKRRTRLLSVWWRMRFVVSSVQLGAVQGAARSKLDPGG